MPDAAPTEPGRGPRGTTFLDASAAEPLLPQAREAWLAAQDAGWGDPTRLHRPGRLAAQALDRAREVVAAELGCRPDEVTFTASAAWSGAAAVSGISRGRARHGSLVVTSTIEHSSVLNAADAAGGHRPVAVDRLGHLDLAAWREAVAGPEVALAAIQVANHEVGTLQPYVEAAQACAAAGVPLVLDATAALGRVPISSEAPWAALVGGAAAFGGPVSVGILALRRTARWRAPYGVDDYQQGVWPGTPDVPAIVAAAVALEVWRRDRDEVGARQHRQIETIRAGVAERVPDVDVAGDPTARLPHLLTFSALYVDGETLTLELDRAGFAVASGSACSAFSDTPSHVLTAMGALTHGNLRIGLTRQTTDAEVDAFLDVLPGVVAEIRGRLGAP